MNDMKHATLLDTTLKHKERVTTNIDSKVWKDFLVKLYQDVNEGFKRNPPKAVELALQAKVNVIGILIQKITELENQGRDLMPLDVSNLMKRLVNLDDLKVRVRETEMTNNVRMLAKVVKESTEKAISIDPAWGFSYTTLYRKVKDMQTAGELDKSFLVTKRGENYWLAYDPDHKPSDKEPDSNV